MYSCLYVCGVTGIVDAGMGKCPLDCMMAGLGPKSTGGGECVTVTIDDLAMVMGGTQELNKKSGKGSGCDCRLLLGLLKYSSLEGEYCQVFPLSLPL